MLEAPPPLGASDSAQEEKFLGFVPQDNELPPKSDLGQFIITDDA